MTADSVVPEVMTLDDVARYCRVDVSTIHRWRKTEGMPVVRIGGAVRFRKASIDAWLTEREERSVNPAVLTVGELGPRRRRRQHGLA